MPDPVSKSLLSTGFMLKNSRDEYWTGMEWIKSPSFAARYAMPATAYLISKTFPEEKDEITIVGESLTQKLFIVDPDDI